MEDSKRRIGIYIPFAKSEIQRALAYRLSFFAFILADILQISVAIYLWNAIFNSSSKTVINGFTKIQMLTYVVISFITVMSIGSGTEWVVAGEVSSGEIAINLIRPINYQIRLLFQALGSLFWQTIAISLPLWFVQTIVLYFSVGQPLPSLTNIGLYLISLIMSFLLWFLFNFCFGLMAFYVTYIWGLNILKENLVRFLSGAVIPLIFLPMWLQKFISFLPFGSINYTPVMLYLGKFKGNEALKALGVQFLWVVLLFVLSNVLWKKATKRLTIMGG